MARSSIPSGPIPVDAIQHSDKRPNIPTADLHDFVDETVETVGRLLYPRDPSLDPQLVWRGKDEQDSEDLVADAPPIYIQEKIDPRVLIENLRATARRNEPEPELTLFDSFDGLDELEQLEFYQHDANWSNRMILGDSLQVMASLAEREQLRGKVQMVYLDPPYGIKFGSNWQTRTGKRDVKDGNVEDAAREAEQIKAFRDTWELGIHSYLAYLRDRLVVTRDLLTVSGSVFVQIGDENVHLVRSLLDEVFGSENFVSQISFATTSGFSQASALGRSGDYLLWYARDLSSLKSRRLWRLSKDRQGYNWVILENGQTRGLTAAEKNDASLLPHNAVVYTPDNIQSQGASSGSQAFTFQDRVYSPGPSSHWKASFPLGMERLAAANRIHVAKNSIRYIRRADDFGLQAYTNNWTDTATGNFTDDKIYVVQSGTKVIERCILLATDPGDLVVDPTCGSGTTAYVAEQWGRRWITVDTSRVALTLARQRLMGARFPYYLLADSDEGRKTEQEVSQKPVRPKSTTGDIRQGFVYERAQHITLGSIANNPDIHRGMTREDTDEAIKRHAEFEFLLDRPYEDKGKVRVSGPFTVESLSPHRAISFSESDPAHIETATERDAAMEASGVTFERSILDNLAKAGIQNGRRSERIEFASLNAHAGSYVQAIGEPRGSEDGTVPESVAISVGPQYGTVSPTFIKQAAREAIQAGAKLLCVLGFAFDPQALNVTDDETRVEVEYEAGEFASVAGARKLGKIQVLFVRMNVDLLMGEALKKTGAGNLFTVFGEPDIDVRRDGDEVTVELRGVDVYDPTTGEIRSSDTSRIALWMVDTNYNEESFFVRHCYFTGGNDPFKKLKTALKADINADAWATLYTATSRPFSTPTTGKIAVKVINDYGDEVMKIISID